MVIFPKPTSDFIFNHCFLPFWERRLWISLYIIRSIFWYFIFLEREHSNFSSTNISKIKNPRNFWYNRYEYRINNLLEWSTCNYFYPFKYSLIFYYCELRKKFICTCSCPRSDGYFGIKLLFTTTSCIHTLFLFLAFNKAFNIFDVWVRQ